MKQLENLQKLNKLSYFTVQNLQKLLELSDNSLYANIKRWLKNGELIQLKRGLYVTNDYLQKIKDTSSYSEFVANKIYQPSYLSTEYVLQKYNVLTESVFATTSITTKKTTEFNNMISKYTYSNITDKLFTGYELVEKQNYQILEATKAKALFDFLYLRLYRKTTIDKEIIQGLRLNLDEFKKVDLKELEKYCQLTRIEKFLSIPKIITELQNAN